MKYLVLPLLATLALTACTRDDDTPAPARLVRPAQTLTISYSRSASTLPGDTVLQSPRLRVFVLPATANPDGTYTYPPTSGVGAVTPLADITDFSAPTVITVPAASVPASITDGAPTTGLRLVFTTANRPGRRTTPSSPANAQNLVARVLVNGTSRVTLTHNGLAFSKTASAVGGVFTTAVETNYSVF